MKRLCMSLWLCSLLVGCGSSPLPTALSATMPIISTVTVVPSATTPLQSTYTPTTLSSPTVTALPTRTFTPTATPFPRATVAKDTLLRNGPSIEFAVAAKIPSGESVELRARNQEGTWVQVKWNQGASGWISTDALASAKDTIVYLPQATYIPAPPLPLLNWKGNPVETVCLSIKRTFAAEFTKDNPTSKPTAIDDEIKKYLQGLGMTVVAPGSRCDAILAIEQTILPTGTMYTAQANKTVQYCYSGVSVDSLTTLTAPEAKLDYSTRQSRPNENQITGCPLSSRDLGESYFGVGLALQKFWGDNALGVMLQSNQIDATKYTLIELAQLGPKGRRFVPAIIDFLRRPGPESARIPASVALQAITLMNYGTDADEWELWWAKQQPSPTPKPLMARTPTSAPATPKPQGLGTPTSSPATSVSTSGAPQDLPVVFAETFNDNTNGWMTGDDNQSDSLRNYNIANKMMLWSIKTQSAIFHGDVPKSMPTVTNFSAQSQVQHLTGAETSSDGLMFRMSDWRSYYTLEIRDNQTFEVTSYVAGHFDWLIRATYTKAIQPGQQNTLQVTGAGAHFEFFINGQKVAQIDDSQLATGGVGLATNVAKNDPSLFAFFNLEVRGK